MIDREPECWRCKRTLGEYFARPWSLNCRRCKGKIAANTLTIRSEIGVENSCGSVSSLAPVRINLDNFLDRRILADAVCGWSG